MARARPQKEGPLLLVSPETDGALFLYKPWSLHVRLPKAFVDAHKVTAEDVRRAVSEATVLLKDAVERRAFDEDVGPCKRCASTGTGAGTPSERQRSILAIATTLAPTSPSLVETSNGAGVAVDFEFPECHSLCPSSRVHWGGKPLFVCVAGLPGVVLVSGAIEMWARFRGQVPSRLTTAAPRTFPKAQSPAEAVVPTPPDPSSSRGEASNEVRLHMVCSTNLTAEGVALLNVHLCAMLGSKMQQHGFLGFFIKLRPSGNVMDCMSHFSDSAAASRAIQLCDEFVTRQNPWHIDLRDSGAFVLLSTSW